MKLELAQALYALGNLRPEALGDFGVALLQEGRGTPAVRQLAGLENATSRDLQWQLPQLAIDVEISLNDIFAGL